MREELQRLRAHHGMCLAFFRGQGYSGEFTCHMGQVLDSLRRNPPVLLLDGADDICVCCPKLRGGVCETAEKVRSYDRQVLELCGLRAGDILPWEDFAALVRENILQPGRREAVCGDCQWNGLCR